jgi:cysteine desulfurase family protein (TIGR01976 family)
MQTSIFPIAAVRAAFPALGVRDGEQARVYLDNPAGTQVPRAVPTAISGYMVESNANLGGAFSTSRAAGEVVLGARRAMADFLGAESEREIVVGPSMTALTFAFSRSLGRVIAPGDEIVVTRMDHEGNVAPWLEVAAERRATIRWVPFDGRSWRVEPAALAGALSEKTRVVALNYANNLTGSVNDVHELCELVRQAGAISYVDAVAYAPHRSIDVRALGCDFLTCSAYKFFGPHLGVLWGRFALLESLHAYKARPQSAEIPDKFEMGTPQIELHAGLTAAVDYFAWLGSQVCAASDRRTHVVGAFGAIAGWESVLARRLIDGLQNLAGVTIVGIAEPAQLHARVPTVSFTHERLSSPAIARALARRGIFVWSGHNFALETVRSLGIDEEGGVVRAGLVHYNTAEEIDALVAALGAVVSTLKEHA